MAYIKNNNIIKIIRQIENILVSIEIKLQNKNVDKYVILY